MLISELRLSSLEPALLPSAKVTVGRASQLLAEGMLSVRSSMRTAKARRAKAEERQR